VQQKTSDNTQIIGCSKVAGICVRFLMNSNIKGNRIGIYIPNPAAFHIDLAHEWTRRESNPRPKIYSFGFFHHSHSIEIPLPERRMTGSKVR
jgi:hypothetical protein